MEKETCPWLSVEDSKANASSRDKKLEWEANCARFSGLDQIGTNSRELEAE
jgi:hypothetical protein